jgi:hypothetical protein
MPPSEATSQYPPVLWSTAMPTTGLFRCREPVEPVGLCVLAALERSVPFGVFAVGFLGLALLSCLYDEVNIFQRLGMAGLFQGGANALPNLLIPGLYLLVGGFGFWVASRRVVASR